jgi:hypothetical protein
MSRQGTDLSRLETSAPALAGADKLFVVSKGAGIADLEGNLFEAARCLKCAAHHQDPRRLARR